MHWPSGGTWAPDDLLQPDILHDCMWGTSHSLHIINWLRTITWEAAPGAQSTKWGTSWFELCYSYLVITGPQMVINDGNQAKFFLPNPIWPGEEGIAFSTLVFAFGRAIQQILQLTGQVWVPSEQGQVMGLTLFGNAHGSLGIKRRCAYQHRDAIYDSLKMHFRGQSVLQVPRLSRSPGYLSTAPQRHSLSLHAMDVQDQQNGWHSRFSRYNNAKPPDIGTSRMDDAFNFVCSTIYIFHYHLESSICHS